MNLNVMRGSDKSKKTKKQSEHDILGPHIRRKHLHTITLLFRR